MEIFVSLSCKGRCVNLKRKYRVLRFRGFVDSCLRGGSICRHIDSTADKWWQQIVTRYKVWQGVLCTVYLLQRKKKRKRKLQITNQQNVQALAGRSYHILAYSGTLTGVCRPNRDKKKSYSIRYLQRQSVSTLVQIRLEFIVQASSL